MRYKDKSSLDNTNNEQNESNNLKPANKSDAPDTFELLFLAEIAYKEGLIDEAFSDLNKVRYYLHSR